MRTALENHKVVTLDAMDNPNLIPMFNSYSWAAEIIHHQRAISSENVELVVPSQSNEKWRKEFTKAGFIIENGQNHYTIVSWHKGGVCYHLKKKPKRVVIDAGVVAKTSNGKYYSTQAYNRENILSIENDTVTIKTRLTRMHQTTPGPIKFIILRILNLTVMRNLHISHFIKKMLVKHLITSKKRISLSNIRVIKLGENLDIHDKWSEENRRLKRVILKRPFSAIHMASQGYWQQQDDVR